jgi:hypothetical protein
LDDQMSRVKLCEARCIFMELHEWFQPGCQAAYDFFLRAGCPEAQRFQEVTTTGEYTLICQSSLVRARDAADGGRRASSMRKLLDAKRR